jgi:hypothetical protein
VGLTAIREEGQAGANLLLVDEDACRTINR